MEGEELKFELRERLEDAYRLHPNAQIALYIFLELVVLVALYVLEVPLVEGFIIFLFVTTALYPIVIKIRNIYSETLGIALYGATISALGLYIVDMVLKIMAGGETRTAEINALMATVFLLVFGIELFHHVYEKARVLRVKWVYIVDVILSVIFAYIVYRLLSLWGFDFPITLLLTGVATLFYFVAIKPETPF